MDTTTDYIKTLTESEDIGDVTTSPELDSIMFQVSEINSYIAVTADDITDIKAQTEIQTINMFVVIAFLGMVCGLLITNNIRK